MIDPDEPFYAQSAREMVEARDWLTPQIYGAPQFEKPIFYYWLVAGSFKLFGESEFSGRLPTALFSTLLVLMTWAWGSRVFNPRAGILAALVMATGLEYAVMSRLMLTDVPLATFLAGSVFCYWLALTDLTRRQIWLFSHLVFTALAVLTKGPIGSLIPLLAIGTFSLVARETPLWRGRGFLAGIAAYLVIVLPWYCAMFVWHARQFWEEFFIRDNWLRMFYAEHPANNHFYYYPGLLLLGSIPWLPVVAATVRRVWTNARHDRRLLFICSWLVSSLVFLTLAQSKLPSYAFFLFVPVALLAGVTLDSISRLGFRDRSEKWIVLAASVLQLVAALSAPLLKVARPFQFPAILTACCLAVGTALVIRRMWTSWIIATAAASLVLISSALTFSRDHVEADSSARPIALQLEQLRGPGEPLLSGKFLVRGIIYYTRMPVSVLANKAQPFWAAHPLPVIVWRQDGLTKYLETHPTALCAVRESEWQILMKKPPFAGWEAYSEFGPNVIVRARAPSPEPAVALDRK